MAEKTGPKDSTRIGTAAPVANQPAGKQVSKPAAGSAAKDSVPAFGGNRGGKARADGLAPGSEAAEDADRKRDRERKRLARQKAAIVSEPPPLPSAVAAPPDSIQPAPGDSGALAPGQTGAPSTAVPWDPAALRPLFDEIIEGAEEARVNKLRGLATKAALPDKLVTEIARDAKYSPTVKRTLSLTAPNVAAKTMNRIGISGKFSDEAILITALIGNFVQGRRLQGKLKKLIEQRDKAAGAKNVVPMAAKTAEVKT